MSGTVVHTYIHHPELCKVDNLPSGAVTVVLGTVSVLFDDADEARKFVNALWEKVHNLKKEI
ncbi:hypothetical protein C731_2977 [Mycolicibacterium hassiacum DSM 44199]|uniref:Uncharacterized protein n=1 Tax=Mycolicibacterium hassiacum (strain DSM 44199 / CIP 105218 / JCM 12690 / 3849) TaxID=1122247 RepID=K5BJE5_MYCHD|nr:hypothetical protein [Mycolicibacterium hassiacum]EKF22974.1 hypothetical protein C731_2977 [Mycolicibacterium hassiacum DSM 44199]MDA4086036.1 hypothetical protein [Mycolicibacterium hassiacum DSM 44199]VCT89493.1 hypothetical protein MHAS_01187 [Mycolicibacterium hassiacum DSM 44199]